MILDWHHNNGRNQTKTAAHFQQLGFPTMRQPLVSAWLKDEATIRNHANYAKDLSIKRTVAVSNTAFEQSMVIFITQAEARQMTLTGVPQVERLALSDGWLAGFKRRTGLRQVCFHGEAASVDLETVGQERARMQALLAQWPIKDVFNMDETALFYAMTPERGLATEQRSGTKQAKTRLTIALTTNGDGTERLPPFIIGRYWKPRCFQGKTGDRLGFYYRANTRA